MALGWLAAGLLHWHGPPRPEVKGAGSALETQQHQNEAALLQELERRAKEANDSLGRLVQEQKQAQAQFGSLQTELAQPARMRDERAQLLKRLEDQLDEARQKLAAIRDQHDVVQREINLRSEELGTVGQRLESSRQEGAEPHGQNDFSHFTDRVSTSPATATISTSRADKKTGSLSAMPLAIPPLSNFKNLYSEAAAGKVSPQCAGALDRVYVPNHGSGSVTVIDPDTFRVVGSFAIGRGPQHVVPS